MKGWHQPRLGLRIPMCCQRRDSRKRIVAPDGTAISPGSKPQPDGTLVKALARAWRWQRMLDDGVYASVSEIGDAENISKSDVSRILRLALLAPDIWACSPGGPISADAGEAGAAAAGDLGEQRILLLALDHARGSLDQTKERAQRAALSKVMLSKGRPRSRAWA